MPYPSLPLCFSSLHATQVHETIYPNTAVMHFHFEPHRSTSDSYSPHEDSIHRSTANWMSQERPSKQAQYRNIVMCTCQYKREAQPVGTVVTQQALSRYFSLLVRVGVHAALATRADLDVDEANVRTRAGIRTDGCTRGACARGPWPSWASLASRPWGTET